RSALKNFLGGVVAQDHDAAVVEEISFLKVAAVRDIELAHLAIGQIHAAGHDGYHAGADFESEVAIDLAADCPDQRHFIANRLNILQFVGDFLACALAARLQTGLPWPQDDDVVAHIQKSMKHAAAQTLAIRQQQHDRYQAPTYPQHGQSGARAIAHERLPALRDEFF